MSRTEKEQNRLNMRKFRDTHPNYAHEQYEKHKHKWKATQKAYYKKNREKILAHKQALKMKALSIIGDSCFVCDKKTNLVFHEKTNKRHMETPQYVLKYQECFVTLCRHCHLALHWVLKFKDKTEELLR